MDKPIKTIPEPTRIPATLVFDIALGVASGEGEGEDVSALSEAKSKESWSRADKTWGDCFTEVGDGDFIMAVDVALGVGVGEPACDVEEVLGVGDGLGVGSGAGQSFAWFGVGLQLTNQLPVPSGFRPKVTLTPGLSSYA